MKCTFSPCLDRSTELSKSDTCLSCPFPQRCGMLWKCCGLVSANFSNMSPEGPLRAEAPPAPASSRQSSSMWFPLVHCMYRDVTHTHRAIEVETRQHTPVCHLSPVGLPQTHTDITIKVRTPRRCTVIHHMRPSPHTHRTYSHTHKVTQ